MSSLFFSDHEDPVEGAAPGGPDPGVPPSRLPPVPQVLLAGFFLAEPFDFFPFPEPPPPPPPPATAPPVVEDVEELLEDLPVVS